MKKTRVSPPQTQAPLVHRLALVLLQDQKMWTLPLGLSAFQGQFSRDYGQLNSAIVMTVLPATIVYLIFQRYFVSGLTSGAVKG